MSRVVLQILERYSTDKEYELQKSHDKNPFHTLRYDFKPASVNSDEPASLELSSKGEVTIKAPNIAGSSSSHTVFRGQRRPHVKECLLVIDNRTGEMVLQKLTDNITVKATRTLGGNGATGNTSTTTSSNSQATSQSTPNPFAGNGSGGGNGGPIKASNHLQHNNNANSSNNNNSLRQNSHNHTATNTTDGPQLSEESSSSSDDDDDDDDDSADDSSDSGSSSSSSSSGSNDEGFTF